VRRGDRRVGGAGVHARAAAGGPAEQDGPGERREPRGSLRQASIELGVPVRRLEYEIVASPAGQRSWARRKSLSSPTRPPGPRRPLPWPPPPGEPTAAPQQDKDGEVFRPAQQPGVFLKVTQPSGGVSGRRAPGAGEAFPAGSDPLRRRSGGKVVRHADGEYIRVGEFEFNPVTQSTLTVDITDLEMKAYITVTPPGPGGADLALEEIKGLLHAAGVSTACGSRSCASSSTTRPTARSSWPRGHQAGERQGRRDRLQLQRPAQRGAAHREERASGFPRAESGGERRGRQILATKRPAEEGSPGRTVTARACRRSPAATCPSRSARTCGCRMTASAPWPPSTARCCSPPVGSTSSGVHSRRGRELQDGNILFLGTVFVKGNVEDGFTSRRPGTSRSWAAWASACWTPKGGHRPPGRTGQDRRPRARRRQRGGEVHRERHVEAEENVLVSDGIIHSFVDANKRIVCQGAGPRSSAGGWRAAEEIHAKNPRLGGRHETAWRSASTRSARSCWGRPWRASQRWRSSWRSSSATSTPWRR